jgi:dihydroorotase-like cyclic amidohydrolase
VHDTAAVVRRGMSLEHAMAVPASHAAKLLGVSPRNGAMAVGSDADSTIIDPTVKKRWP